MQLQTLQMYRGFAALAVLLYHIDVVSKLRLGQGWGAGWFTQGTLGVDFFFVLSGFIIYHVHARDLGHPEQAPRYFVKRFFRIYPLLFLLMCAKLFYALALGAGGIPAEKLNAEVILSSFLMLPIAQEHGGSPLIHVAWTLSHEFLFYAVFGLGVWLGRGFAMSLFAAWSTLIFGLAILPTGEAGLWTGFLLDPHNLQFMAGVAVGIAAERGLLAWRTGTWLLTAAGVGFLSALGVLPSPTLSSHFEQRLFWGGVFACLVAGSVAIERARSVALPRWLTLPGDASYSIYLVHSSIQVLLVHTSFTAAMALGLSHFAFMALVGVFSLAGSLAVYFAVERPLFRWTSRLSAGPPRTPGSGRIEATLGPRPARADPA